MARRPSSSLATCAMPGSIVRPHHVDRQGRQAPRVRSRAYGQSPAPWRDHLQRFGIARPRSANRVNCVLVTCALRSTATFGRPRERPKSNEIAVSFAGTLSRCRTTQTRSCSHQPSCRRRRAARSRSTNPLVTTPRGRPLGLPERPFADVAPLRATSLTPGCRSRGRTPDPPCSGPEH